MKIRNRDKSLVSKKDAAIESAVEPVTRVFRRGEVLGFRARVNYKLLKQASEALFY